MAVDQSAIRLANVIEWHYHVKSVKFLINIYWLVFKCVDTLIILAIAFHM